MQRGVDRVAAILLAVGVCVAGCQRYSRKPGDLRIYAAVYDNDIAKVKELLARGCDVNAADSQGMTALCVAVLCESTAMAEVLIAHGAKVDHVTMARAVSGYGAKPMIDLLLAHGAPAGGSGLVAAVLRDRLDLAEYLISKGADLNAKGIDLSRKGVCADLEEEGSQPLFVAAYETKPKAAALLLEHGANPNAKDGTGYSCPGYTAAKMAEERGDPELIRVFREAKTGSHSSGRPQSRTRPTSGR
ncbi:MAG: ankyrin repeat domain-containing protein [Planctomycetota bacterium]